MKLLLAIRLKLKAICSWKQSSATCQAGPTSSHASPCDRHNCNRRSAQKFPHSGQSVKIGCFLEHHSAVCKKPISMLKGASNAVLSGKEHSPQCDHWQKIGVACHLAAWQSLLYLAWLLLLQCWSLIASLLCLVYCLLLQQL